MKNVQLLDCTLRDGAYIVDAKFGTPAIKGIVNKLQNAGVEIIECGWLKNSAHVEGTTFYHVPSDFEAYLTQKDSSITYTAMIDWDRYDISNLPEYDGKSIDAVRVVFPHGRHREGVAIGRQILNKGYRVFFQAANTLAYSEEDLIDLANEINTIDTVCLSVVDTFGAMYEEDLDRILEVLNTHLNPEIKIGFHSHNNQQLSFALSMHFVQTMKNCKRDVIVDASLCGMGRGAGNATTELVVSFLNKKSDCHYDMDAVMDAIDIYMSYFQENYRWGYSTPYFIAGLYCCHVNNIAYLLKNHRTNARDMRNIVESLPPEDRKKYDYDLLEQKYMQNQNHNVDDAAAKNTLIAEFRDRNVLLIAPGKSSITMKDEIKQYIAKTKPVVIGINAMVSDYSYDYTFYVNAARYDYAKETQKERFESCRRILTSNVKAVADKNEYIIAFNHVIRRGWEHFDNAAICCLRMMDYFGLEHVAIAGFDGFKEKYNESYADEHLPSLNPGGKWEALNDEIAEIFADFKKRANSCKTVEFVTPSYFE